MKKILILLTVFAVSNVSAQVSGNEVYANANAYGNRSYSNYTNNNKFGSANVITTDSTMTISTQVLMNKPADHYVLSIGVSQEGKTVEACNIEINDRITSFIQGLKDLKINAKDVYVDFITQNKIYDYKIEGDLATQYLDGFQIKKNVIIEIDDVALVDQISTIAAENEIYDIIKVDYIDTDIDAIYQELFEKAVQLIKARKALYTSVTNTKFNGKSRVLTDYFEAIYPKTQYQKYKAYESSEVKSRYNYGGRRFVEKEARKSETFYYDGVAPQAYDVIVNPVQTKVGIQYILELKIIYETEK